MQITYLLPIFFVGTIFFITQIIKRILKIELPKSKNQRDKDADTFDIEINSLKLEQEKLDSVSSFVEYSLLSRKIIALQKKKETLFKSEQLLQKSIDPKIKLFLGTFQKIIENSFFFTLVVYFLLRNVHVPLLIKTDMFWPIGNYLGFYLNEKGFYFAISFGFSALSIRFCNAIGNIFIED